jgi:hypothetical protein
VSIGGGRASWTTGRLFRAEGVDIVSTFTFFKVEDSGAPLLDRTAHVAGVEHLFFQLLVSQCDYAFMMDRADQRTEKRSTVLVRSKPDGYPREGEGFIWDRKDFKALPLHKAHKL